MRNAGEITAESLREWDMHEPITLSHWQVRMVLQSLATSYDLYAQDRPSDRLPAIRAVTKDEVMSLIQSTINDIAIQAGLADAVEREIVVPTFDMGPS
jgi:hypothetical protein